MVTGATGADGLQPGATALRAGCTDRRRCTDCPGCTYCTRRTCCTRRARADRETEGTVELYADIETEGTQDVLAAIDPVAARRRQAEAHAASAGTAAANATVRLQRV